MSQFLNIFYSKKYKSRCDLSIYYTNKNFFIFYFFIFLLKMEIIEFIKDNMLYISLIFIIGIIIGSLLLWLYFYIKKTPEDASKDTPIVSDD